VSNALKHAFEGREQGTVVVTLKRRTGETVELRVQDDGVGFPPGVDIQTLTSMGMNIINTLTSQIFGTVTMERAQGTAFLITFPG
jgi:two-component sensor histidine kinase